MPTYIAFLRAVNVGKRKYPMAELRAVLSEAGFEDVETHIQTGNVRLRTQLRSRAKVEAALEKVFAEDRGFEVATIVLTPKELVEVAHDADDVGDPAPEFGHYVEILRTTPNAEECTLIESQDHPGQRAVVRGRAVHLLLDVPFHEAKGPNAAVKRALGDCTNRNVKVIRVLVEKWSA